jgi:hypothetical protein
MFTVINSTDNNSRASPSVNNEIRQDICYVDRIAIIEECDVLQYEIQKLLPKFKNDIKLLRKLKNYLELKQKNL